MTRFPVLQDEQMTPGQRAVAAEIASGPRGGVRGPFIALLHNPQLAQRVQALGEYLRFETALPGPLLELAILVTARRWTCQYEWVAHERLARTAGLADAVIRGVAERTVPSTMTRDEVLVHDFCLRINATGEPGDDLFAQVRERFGLDGLLDLIALCGYYSTLAMVLNAARLPLPDNLPPPLDD